MMCETTSVGEYIEDFHIYENGVKNTYKIGVDVYGENEFNIINLQNNGVHIPNSVQKAIFCTNVHEDENDLILLNRKWKELLSNYWDILANRGSYKSLYNSLNWFEYGDILKLKEIWGRTENSKKIYEERDIKEVLENKYYEEINGFFKTTYIAITAAIKKMKENNNGVIYDEEHNPILEHIVHRWSINDLSLKLSLLGNFYKSYFMPIHLDLIKSTIEDVIYSNTTKLYNSHASHREDTVCHYKDIKCSVGNNSIFRLEPVSVRVGKETIFGHQYERAWGHYGEVDVVGVQKNNPSFDVTSNMNQQIKTYLAQHFNGIGAVVDFKMEIPLTNGDFIKKSHILYKGDKTNEWKLLTEYKPLYEVVEFSILCTKDQTYDFRFQFESAMGDVFVKRVVFNVINDRNTELKLYKIQNIGEPDLNNGKINEFSFGRMLESKENNLTFKQYIPARNVDPTKTDYKGICLNNLLIIKSYQPEDRGQYINKHYFIFIRKVSDELVYTICISKKFGFVPNLTEIAHYEIYRNDYIFYPDFHELVEFGTEDEKQLKFHTITDDDALCVIPELAYGKLINEAQWEFINVSKIDMSSIIPTVDIKEPFIASDKAKPLEPGFYNIVFRYKLVGEDKINTITLDSAFLKV